MDDYAGWERSFFREEYSASRYVGLDRAEAEQLAVAEGVSAVRVADLDMAPKARLTTDLRRHRLTLLVHHGKVVRAGFF